MSVLGELWQGVATVPRAVGLYTRHGRLCRLAVIPAALSLALFALLVWLSVRYSGGLLHHFWAGPASASRWAAGAFSLAHWLVAVLLVLLSAVAALLGSNLIAAPFVDLLSQAAEAALGRPVTEERLTLLGFVSDLLVALREVLMDLALGLVLLIALLPLHLVPVVGSAAHGLCSGLVAAAFAGVGMAGSALWRRRLRGFLRWRQVRATPWPLIGLGLATMVLMGVPLAQLLTMPVAVVAGTLLVLDLSDAGRLLPPPS